MRFSDREATNVHRVGVARREGAHDARGHVQDARVLDRTHTVGC